MPSLARVITVDPKFWFFGQELHASGEAAIGKAVKSVEFPHDQGPRLTFDVVSVEEPLRPSQR
jgi:hypothetical protein